SPSLPAPLPTRAIIYIIIIIIIIITITTTHAFRPAAASEPFPPSPPLPPPSPPYRWALGREQTTVLEDEPASLPYLHRPQRRTPQPALMVCPCAARPPLGPAGGAGRVRSSPGRPERPRGIRAGRPVPPRQGRSVRVAGRSADGQAPRDRLAERVR